MNKVAQNTEKYVVLGDGPVGIHAAQLLVERSESAVIHVYGKEDTCAPYNRSQLTSCLAESSINNEDIYYLKKLKNQEAIKHYSNCEIVEIDTVKKVVIDKYGVDQEYTKLIIASGSNAVAPQIRGVNKDGVIPLYTIENLKSVLKKLEYAKKIVVLGAGALGIETAFALAGNGKSVSVIEKNNQLLKRYINKEESDYLVSLLKSKGVVPLIGNDVVEIEGEKKVTNLRLADGQSIECDLVVLSIGSKPNVQIATMCGININNGILVNEKMETNICGIYAAGDCAEHEGEIYGLLEPGLKQASVAVNSILGVDSKFRKISKTITIKSKGEQILKIVTSNKYSHLDEYRCIKRKFKDSYIRCYIKDNMIASYVEFGKTKISNNINNIVENQVNLNVVRKVLFKVTGNVHVFKTKGVENVIVCNCFNVSRESIVESINDGCLTLSCISNNTYASTGCGTCKSTIEGIIQGKELYNHISINPIMYVQVIIACALFIVYYLTDPGYVDIYTTRWNWSGLVSQNDWSENTGYLLLSVLLMSPALSIRKRLKKVKYLDYRTWLLTHVFIAMLSVIVLAFHTGTRLGNNLNNILSSIFAIVVMLGVMNSMLSSIKGNSVSLVVTGLHSVICKLHYLSVIPLFMLIAVHVLYNNYF